MNYFKYLQEINKDFNCGDDCLRIDSTEVQRISMLLDTFFKEEFNLDSFLKICIYLYNYQIFLDGNTKTIIKFMQAVLNNNGYNLDLSYIKENYLYTRCYFPTVVEGYGGEVTEKDLTTMKQPIKKLKKREE